MAITASVAVNPSTVTAQQTVAVTLTVNNSAGTAVLVTGIQPLCYPTLNQPDGPSGAVGLPALGPGMTVSIPASGSLTFSWGMNLFSPQGGYAFQGGNSLIYVIGATVYTSDGSVTTATTANVTVNHFP